MYVECDLSCSPSPNLFVTVVLFLLWLRMDSMGNYYVPVFGSFIHSLPWVWLGDTYRDGEKKPMDTCTHVCIHVYTVLISICYRKVGCK